MDRTARSDIRITDQFDPELFWQRHGKKVIGGIAALAALGGGMLLWQQREKSAIETASLQLAAARDAAGLEEVANRYLGKEPAAEALLRLADLQYREGRFAEAVGSYDRFLQHYPQHPLTATVRLGRATVVEAAGDFQGATEQYGQIINSSGSRSTALAAKLGLARCAEALGRPKEARQLYEELLATAQGSPWQAETYLRWLVLGREQRAAAETLPAPPAPKLGDGGGIGLTLPNGQK